MTVSSGSTHTFGEMPQIWGGMYFLAVFFWLGEHVEMQGERPSCRELSSPFDTYPVLGTSSMCLFLSYIFL